MRMAVRKEAPRMMRGLADAHAQIGRNVMRQPRAGQAQTDAGGPVSTAHRCAVIRPGDAQRHGELARSAAQFLDAIFPPTALHLRDA